MKLRSGFVSNSSTTSFLIYGTYLEDENILTKEICDKIHKLDLTIHYGEEDGVYLGRSWDSIKDDETGKEFRENIKENIKSILGDIPFECFTHEEAFYNG